MKKKTGGHNKLRDSGRTRKTSFHAPPPDEEENSDKGFIMGDLPNMIHDVFWGAGPEGQDGDNVFTYALLLASLDETDAKLMTQLRRATTSENRKIAFKHLINLDFERSIIPFATDENPLGETAAHAVAIVCQDQAWGPDIRKADTAGEHNYYQIIDAALDVAEQVVFVFIKGNKDSEHYDGAVHPKFLPLSKGPWPKNSTNSGPFVFLMSYYEKFNHAQLDAIRTLLRLEDPLQIKVEINKHYMYAESWVEQQRALERAAEIVKDPLAIQPAAATSVATADVQKEADKLPAGVSSQLYAQIKKELTEENERQFAEVRASLRSLQAEVDSLKRQLAAKEPSNTKDKEKV